MPDGNAVVRSRQHADRVQPRPDERRQLHLLVPAGQHGGPEDQRPALPGRDADRPTPAPGPRARPNTPTFTRQWQRCDAVGQRLRRISGATGTTYSPVADDLGHTLVVIVTGTNHDGAATATSGPSSVITLPPPPVNTVTPQITGVADGRAEARDDQGHLGQRRRQLRDLRGRAATRTASDCAPIPGANGDDVRAHVGDDLGHALVTEVTATNLGGSTAETSAAEARARRPRCCRRLRSSGSARPTSQAAELLTGDRLDRDQRHLEVRRVLQLPVAAV